jgi:hypothetical protein
MTEIKNPISLDGVPDGAIYRRLAGVNANHQIASISQAFASSAINQPNGIVQIDADGVVECILVVRHGTAAVIGATELKTAELAVCDDTGELRVGTDPPTVGGTPFFAAAGYATQDITATSFTVTHGGVSRIKISSSAQHEEYPDSFWISHTTTGIQAGTYTGQRLTILVDCTSPTLNRIRIKSRGLVSLEGNFDVSEEIGILIVEWDGAYWREVFRRMMGNVISGCNSYAVGTGNTVADENSLSVGAGASTTWRGSNPVSGQFLRANGYFSAAGDAQVVHLPLKVQTTTGSSSLWIGILPAKTTWKIKVELAVYNITDGKGAGYELNFTARRSASGNTVILGSPTPVEAEDAEMAGCTIAAAVGTLNYDVQVDITAINGKTILWVMDTKIIIAHEA